MSIDESFLLQMNIGGGLGTNKSKSHTTVKVVLCKLMRNVCSLENLVITSMENPIQDMSTSVSRFVNGLH